MSQMGAGSSSYWEEAQLRAAAARGDADAVQRHLDNGVAVNCKDWNGATPLRCAVHQGQLEVVQCLLRAGAAMDAANDGKPLVKVCLDSPLVHGDSKALIWKALQAAAAQRSGAARHRPAPTTYTFSQHDVAGPTFFRPSPVSSPRLQHQEISDTAPARDQTFAPVSARSSAAEAGRGPGSAPVPRPVPRPWPHPATAPVPAPVPRPVPHPAAAPVPAPVLRPVPHPAAPPVPAPVLRPVPHPAAAPVPAHIPRPVPHPAAAPVPAPILRPVPHPAAPPVPAPILRTVLHPAAAPVPAPILRPVPHPAAAPVPAPAPRHAVYSGGEDVTLAASVFDASVLGSRALQQELQAVVLVEGSSLIASPVGVIRVVTRLAQQLHASAVDAARLKERAACFANRTNAVVPALQQLRLRVQALRQADARMVASLVSMLLSLAKAQVEMLEALEPFRATGKRVKRLWLSRDAEKRFSQREAELTLCLVPLSFIISTFPV